MTWIPFFIISFDQITKRLAIFWENNNILLEYNFFFLFKNIIVFNKGISFGMFSNSSSYYVIVLYFAISISLLLVCYWWYQSKSKVDLIAWGMIVGGGASNLVDRLLFEGVLDFISISFNQMFFPIFNIADIAITIGFILLSYKYFFKKNKKKDLKE